MQKYNTNGEPQWPAASYSGAYTTPFAAMDIRADTYAGGLGPHYSGKPSIGGFFNHSDGARPMVLAWEDNRNFTSSTDPIDIYSQAYDTLEQDLEKTNWVAYWDFTSSSSVTLSVKVGIVEWDGTSGMEKGWGADYTWATTATASTTEVSNTWDSGGADPPPADYVGNASMRRLIVQFTRTSGAATIYYDNSTNDSCGSGQDCDSRLSVGSIVPERVLFLGLIIPFLPPAIAWYNRRRKRANMRIICECK